MKSLLIFPDNYDYLQHIEILARSLQILRPVGLEANKKHVGREFAQPGQREARLAALLETVALSDGVETLADWSYNY